MKQSLSYDYIRIKYENGSDTYGGNQKIHPDDGIKKDGCGPLAATDVLAYIEKNFEYDHSEYEELTSRMCGKYFPYRANHGTSGFIIKKGLNRYFKEKNLPLKASWGVPRRRLYQAIAEQLSADLPVIITVGPKYPGIKPTHALSLYQKDSTGQLVPVKSTSGHYMTVTAMDGQWLKVSSWGDVYYINVREYLHYARKYSQYFFTNIICIRRDSRHV